jgi:hypothetical protein
MEFGDLFSFDKKVVPTIIKPIYWIGLLFIPFLGAIYFLTSFGKLFTGQFFVGLWDMCASVVFVVVGVLALRIVAEICLVLFETQDRNGSSGTPQS